MKLYVKLGLAALASLYLVGAILPLSSLWYYPSEVVVRDSVEGTPPQIEFWRVIKRPTLMTYSVVVRPSDKAAPVCEGAGGPFQYQPDNGPVIGRDLNWWVGGNQCNDLKPGRYWMQTCWTAVSPMRALLPAGPIQDAFGWLLPPKSVCRPNSSERGAGYSFEILERTAP